MRRKPEGRERKERGGGWGGEKIDQSPEEPEDKRHCVSVWDVK